MLALSFSAFDPNQTLVQIWLSAIFQLQPAGLVR